MDSVLDGLWGYLLPIVGSVVMALIGWAATQFTTYTGVKIEKSHQETLHSAIMTGIGWAKSKLTGGGTAKSESAVVVEAADYVKTIGAPDAIKALGVSQTTLEGMIASKIEQQKAITV